MIALSSNKKDLMGNQIEPEKSEKFNISLKKFSFGNKSEEFRITIEILVM